MVESREANVRKKNRTEEKRGRWRQVSVIYSASMAWFYPLNVGISSLILFWLTLERHE
jgi:hypothetical protein